jgi:hypothetical protein
MNTSASPRLSCRLARFRAALGGDPARSAHVAGCAGCQRHFAAAAAFDSALRREAALPAGDAPAGLERGILRAVAESRLAPAPAGRRSGTFVWFAGGVLAAVAVAFALAVRSPAPAPGGAVAGSVPQAEPAAPRLVAAEPTPSATRVLKLPSAAALAAENPLQGEIDNVYSDARYALRFLALNFLPAAAVERAATLGNDKG